MPPQYSPQPAPQPTPPVPGGSDPYQFIMNPQQPKRQSRLLPSTNSPKGRIITVVAGLFVLLIAGWIVMSVISSTGNSGTQDLINVTAHQQEIIRISQLGVTTAKTRDTKNLAITAQLAMTSDQQQMLALLGKSHIKVSQAQLNGHKNLQTEAQFTQASQTNQFDTTFSQTLHDELTSYQRAIKSAYTANTGKSARALLNSEFSTANALLGTPAQAN